MLAEDWMVGRGKDDVVASALIDIEIMCQRSTHSWSAIPGAIRFEVSRLETSDIYTGDGKGIKVSRRQYNAPLEELYFAEAQSRTPTGISTAQWNERSRLLTDNGSIQYSLHFHTTIAPTR